MALAATLLFALVGWALIVKTNRVPSQEATQQLRFFVQDFRREMQEKIREVRERRGAAEGRPGRRQQRRRP